MNIDLVPVTVVGAFTCGTCFALLGSIKLPLEKQRHFGELGIGLLLGALNLALIFMMLMSGILIDQWGVERILIGGSLVTGAALAVLAVSESYSAALGSIVPMGLATACVSTGSTVLMPHAFFP